MRAITADVIAAIVKGRSLNKQNTTVEHADGRVAVKLHGHQIATIHAPAGRASSVELTTCGYHTGVTRDRLNAVIEALACLGFHVPRASIRERVLHIGEVPLVSAITIIRTEG